MVYYIKGIKDFVSLYFTYEELKPGKAIDQQLGHIRFVFYL